MNDASAFYEKFAKDYDLFGDITQINKDEEKFYHKIFRKYSVKRVLDCACGTGKHCCLFSKMGYKVRGSDISRAMLSKAQENLKRAGIKVKLKQCDFRELDKNFKEQFDAVTCLATSLPHLYKDQEIIKALHSMKKVLVQKGIAIITQGITHRSLKRERRFDLVVNNKDFSRIFIKDIEKKMLTIHILDIFRSDEDNRMEKYAVRYRIILNGEYKSLLKKAGFSKVMILGDYNMNPYDPEKSKKLIIIGEK